MAYELPDLFRILRKRENREVLQTLVSFKKLWCFTGDNSSFEFKESESAVLLKTGLQKRDILKLSELFLIIMSTENITSSSVWPSTGFGKRTSKHPWSGQRKKEIPLGPTVPASQRKLFLTFPKLLWAPDHLLNSCRTQKNYRTHQR